MGMPGCYEIERGSNRFVPQSGANRLQGVLS